MKHYLGLNKFNFVSIMETTKTVKETLKQLRLKTNL